MHVKLTFRILYFSLRNFSSRIQISLKCSEQKIADGGLSAGSLLLQIPDSNSSGSTASVYKQTCFTFLYTAVPRVGRSQKFLEGFPKLGNRVPLSEKYIPLVGGNVSPLFGFWILSYKRYA